MFENIEKARHLLNSGSTKAAVDEFFNIVQDLKEKNNPDEAGRLLLEIGIAVESTTDYRFLQHTIEKIVTELAAKYPDRVREMSAKWKKWATRLQVLPWPWSHKVDQ